MTITKDGLSVFDKFNFDIKPVGVKLLAKLPDPDNVKKLDEKMALCEMLKKAQEGNSFYVDAGNHACEAGLYVLGQAEAPGPFISGEFGAGLEVFEDARAASRIYHHIPTISKYVVNYVVFAPLDKLTFEPDLLVLTANAGQTEVLLRAASYRTGKIWMSRSSPVIGCAWILVYPYLTGEMNYIVTGLGHGMKRRKLFPEGMQIISIPCDLLPSILDSLRDMPWVPPGYKPDGPEFIRQLLAKLGLTPPV